MFICRTESRKKASESLKSHNTTAYFTDLVHRLPNQNTVIIDFPLSPSSPKKSR